MFSIVAVVVLLSDVYSAADKVMRHSSGHGCGETCLLRSVRSNVKFKQSNDECEIGYCCCWIEMASSEVM